MEFLRQWVQNIITVAIFITLVEMLCPSGKIKKIVRLVSGFVLILAVISPFMGLVGKGVNMKSFELSDSNFLDKKDIEQESKLLEAEQMKQIVKTYRNKLIRQTEDCAVKVKGVGYAKADIIINEDTDSGTFGDIKRIYVDVTASSNEKSNQIDKVEKVIIHEIKDEGQGGGTGIGTGTGTETVSAEDKALTEQVEKAVAAFLSIDRALVTVRVEAVKHK